MITVHSISEYKAQESVAITIGTFDGVHIGHCKILEKVINRAKDANLKSAVLTFFPHPRMVVQKDTEIKLLNTIAEKQLILSKMGLDVLVIHPFTTAFSRLTATEFVRDLLVNKLKSKKIIIGYDHRFGRNRTANINDLVAFGNILDFSVEEIQVQEIEEVSISSTKIRKALEKGDVTTANIYLGYEYMLTGSVKKGKGLGRKLNYPTANLSIEETYKLIPKTGAYTVKSILNGKEVHGMMNIGYNPTVNGTHKTIEIHFFDFKENLYGQIIQIDMLHRLRDERKFDSLDALQEQLAKDKEMSLRYISQ